MGGRENPKWSQKFTLPVSNENYPMKEHHDNRAHLVHCNGN
jgi:hypothetical protein